MVSGETMVATSPRALPAQRLSFRSQPPTLVIRQPEPLSPQLLLEDAVFFLQVMNDGLLVLIYPARERNEQNLPGT